MLTALPPDILEEIFTRLDECSLLGSVSKVNREFHSTALDPKLRAHVRARFLKEHKETCSRCRDVMVSAKSLQTACQSAPLECVRYLVERGADIDRTTTSGETTVYLAACGGHVDTVRYLVEREADYTLKNINGWSPLYIASLRGHLPVVKYLVALGCDISEETTRQQTPLVAAASAGFLEVAKFLSSLGADCEHVDNFGRTPIYIASESGHLDIVRWLAEEKVVSITSTKEKSGRTPMHAAARNGHVDIVKYLHEMGADCDACDKLGHTSIFDAADACHVSVVEYLADRASLNIVAEGGQTPLFAAAKQGSLDIVKCLLSHGADTHVCTKDGVTLLEIAKRSRRSSVVSVLKSIDEDK
eukprot:Rmarinus@m.20865